MATSNPGKAREIRALLKGLPVKILTLTDLGVRTPSPEKGRTFEENAREKSIYYSQKTRFLTLAEDSGLAIEKLDGAPGVLSARFSSPRPTDIKNNQKVLGLMKNLARRNRRAQFVCCLVLSQSGRVIKIVTGKVRGTISYSRKGQHGFGYDPIFYYHPYRKTFGELPSKQKNKVSHRGRALRKMKKFLKTYLRHPPKRSQISAP